MVERFLRLSYYFGLNNGSARQTSWTDQFSISEALLEDWPFSLYIVAASESDEGLGLSALLYYVFYVKCKPLK